MCFDYDVISEWPFYHSRHLEIDVIVIMFVYEKYCFKLFWYQSIVLVANVVFSWLKKCGISIAFKLIETRTKKAIVVHRQPYVGFHVRTFVNSWINIMKKIIWRLPCLRKNSIFMQNKKVVTYFCDSVSKATVLDHHC